MVISSLEPEHESKYNTSKIAASAHEPRNNSVISWMHMRNNGEIRTIGCVGENSADGNSGNERIDFDIGKETDRNQQDTLNNSAFKGQQERVGEDVHVISQNFFPSTPATG
jgi:hypothetical protein